MLYCEPCRKEKDWPKQRLAEKGECRVCGNVRLCHKIAVNDDYIGEPIATYLRTQKAVIATAKASVPRRFKWPTTGNEHPNGRALKWNYGAYFPDTDLVVTDMGQRGTGEPAWAGLEWLDKD